ncbi:MAG: cytidine deaminase [Sphaerochaetaceae bacterium]|nr:cytidine deaminase [Sphaerochaetaceae bacterium]
MIKGLLFDVDGVIFNSEPYIRKAFTNIFAELGAELSDSSFEPIVGTGEITSITYFANLFGLNVDVEDVKRRIYENYGEIIKGKLKAFPGVVDFIYNCSACGVKLAVATSSDRVKFLKSMKETGLDIKLFDAVICGDEVPRTKPAGDIYRYAAAKLCLPADETLVVEDALNGLSAARDAGCSAMGVTTTFDRKTLLLGGADFVADGFENFGGFSNVEELNTLIDKKIKIDISSSFIGELINRASAALENAYAPYSHFRIGAAVLTESGKIHSGCNVENASYGATRCGEQSAILSAVSSEGPATRITALAVASESEVPAPPCSICRQMLNEFSSYDTQVYLYSVKTCTIKHYSFRQLLPLAFEL